MIKDSTTITLTMRERYIIAQALILGINELEKVPGALKELSNIMDMEYLLENQFSEMATPARFSINNTVKDVK